VSPPNTFADNDSHPNPAANAAEAARVPQVRFHHSPTFPRVLEHTGSSLLISTHQPGALHDDEIWLLCPCPFRASDLA
jgi:hypothetical protein